MLMSNRTSDVQVQHGVVPPAVAHAEDQNDPQRAYTSPRCERLGRWSVLTLQQSVIIPP
jgi:hypothetical protein